MEITKSHSHRVKKREIPSRQKNREINSLVPSLAKTLLSRNFLSNKSESKYPEFPQRTFRQSNGFTKVSKNFVKSIF